MPRRLSLVAAALVVWLALVASLLGSGVVWPNRLLAAGYAVRGVDVSAHQGHVDWPTIAAQGVDFAYVKATEGSSFVDPQLTANLTGARDAGLLVGAYHFFSFESPGRAQAEHVIATVPRDDDLLPVAVDVEPYGRFKDEPPDPDAVRRELRVTLDLLRDHYGVTPVVYATGSSYAAYLAHGFDDVTIWIRSVLWPPRLPDGRSWAFWQYSDIERLDGYDGDEPAIDANVFRGTLDDLRALG